MRRFSLIAAVTAMTSVGLVGPVYASESNTTLDSARGVDLGPGVEQRLAVGETPDPGTPEILGNCTGPLCGTIRNSNASDGDLWIIDNWPPERANGAFLKRGETSTKYFKDTDGVYIPSWCTGVRDWAPDFAGGYWYKVSDLFNETIRLDC
jgi:hypothetical protein